MDARESARRLRQESEERERQARRRLEARIAQQDQELERYGHQLQQLRELFQQMLREMEGAAEVWTPPEGDQRGRSGQEHVAVPAQKES